MKKNDLKVKLIQDLAKRRNSQQLLNDKLDKSIFTFLVDHNLLAIFESLNPWCKSIDLKKIVQEIEIRNLLYLSEARELAAVFPSRLIGLKGISLLNNHYQLSERPLSDIDVLAVDILPAELESTLSKMGYCKVPQKKWYANEFKDLFIKETALTPLSLEVHYKLFYNEPSTFCWKQSEAKDGELAQLAPNYQWIHLMGHYAYQHTFLKLFWLLDLYFYYQHKKDFLDWGECAELARELKLERALEGSFYALGLIFQEEEILNLHQSLFWKDKLSLDFLLDPKLKNFKYFLIKHQVKDTLRDSMNYNLGWAGNQLSKILS